MMNTTLSYFEQKSKESRECNCPNAELPEVIGPWVNHGPMRSIRKSTRAAKQIDSPFGPLTFITPRQREKQRTVRKTKKQSPLTQRLVVFPLKNLDRNITLIFHLQISLKINLIMQFCRRVCRMVAGEREMCKIQQVQVCRKVKSYLIFLWFRNHNNIPLLTRY